MASNPMQKKARNSFWLGMLLMLIISAIIIVIMFIVLTKDNKEQEESKETQTYVYRLKTAIASGEEITSSKVESILVNSSAVPAGASASKSKTTDKDGKEKWTDKGFDYLGYKAKVDLPAGTIVCDTMLYVDELQDTERIEEFNMLQLPVDLSAGDYVDVRFQVSSGQDFIVVSHKQVINATEQTIWLQLTEEEIIFMSNAIVESYISPASTLYVAKYVEPGMQKAASVTYVPTHQVAYLIQQNPNIVKEARDELIARYQANTDIRNHIQTELDKYTEESIDNIQTKMLEAREKAIAEREQFLNGVQ